jgi:hypothetical protein
MTREDRGVHRAQRDVEDVGLDGEPMSSRYNDRRAFLKSENHSKLNAGHPDTGYNKKKKKNVTSQSLRRAANVRSSRRKVRVTGTTNII